MILPALRWLAYYCDPQSFRRQAIADREKKLAALRDHLSRVDG